MTGNEKRFVGYHDVRTLPIKKGDKVRIRKGTITKRILRDPKPAGRTFTITVDHILCGSTRTEYVQSSSLSGVQQVQIPEENPKVRWAGSGGYWVEVDINDVEKVAEDDRG
jgi:hypothetical protein